MRTKPKRTYLFNLMRDTQSVKYLLCALHWANCCKHITLNSPSNPRGHKQPSCKAQETEFQVVKYLAQNHIVSR